MQDQLTHTGRWITVGGDSTVVCKLEILVNEEIFTSLFDWKHMEASRWLRRGCNCFAKTEASLDRKRIKIRLYKFEIGTHLGMPPLCYLKRKTKLTITRGMSEL